MRTKQSVCHEIPLGSAATKSSGHSSRVVSHGRNASSGPAAQHCYSSTNQRTTLTWQVVKHSRSGLTHLTAQLLRSPMTAGLPRTSIVLSMLATTRKSLKQSTRVGVKRQSQHQIVAQSPSDSGQGSSVNSWNAALWQQ